MTREQILKVLQSNGVRYDKTIESEDTEGFVSDECAAYAESIYADIEKLVVFGVQNGFSKCEDDIRDLTKLIASLIAGTSRKTVNLAKVGAKHQQIIKGANYLRKEIDMDMLNQLMSNLNVCISAADAIISIRGDNEALCAKLNESKSVLTEIKQTLSDAADLTSKDAAEYQVEIFDALMDWREAVSRYNCYSDTVDGLKSALEAAKKWQQLTSAVKRKAKANVDYYVYNDKYDDVDLIITAAKYAERTTGLRDHLNNFRSQTEMLYGVDALQAELNKAQTEFFEQRDSLSKRIAEIKEQTDSVLFAYQNGEMDAVEADMKVADLDEEAADIEEQLANLQEDFNDESQDLKLQIKDAQGGSRIRDKIAKNFESFVNKVEAYKQTDPAMFVVLCERIDFNGVNDTLTGRLSDSQIEEVYIKVETVIRETEEDIKRQRKTLTGFERINDKSRENRRHEEKVLREQEAERRKRLQESRTSVGGRVPAGNAEEDAKKRLEGRLARRMSGTAVPSADTRTEDNGATNIRNEDK